MLAKICCDFWHSDFFIGFCFIFHRINFKSIIEEDLASRMNNSVSQIIVWLWIRKREVILNEWRIYWWKFLSFCIVSFWKLWGYWNWLILKIKNYLYPSMVHSDENALLLVHLVDSQVKAFFQKTAVQTAIQQET